MITQYRLLALLVAALFAGSLACTPSKNVKADDPVAAAAEGEEAPVEEEEDLTLRKPVEEKIIRYVEGVTEEAQDLFREGVAAALKDPPDYQLAKEKFQAAIEADKGFLEAYTNLGKVYERLRKPEMALSVYRTALDENPEDLDARAYVGKIYLVNARHARDVGDEVEFNRLVTEARAIFDAVVARDEDNVAVNNALALYHLIQGDPEKAEDYVVRVLAVDPTNTEGLNTRGLINLERGNLRIAKWIFAQKVMQLDPNSPEAHTNLGVTYAKMGELPPAVVHYTKAIELDQDNIPARVNLAAIQLNWLDYESASKQYTEVLQRQPDNVSALIGLGSSELGNGNYEEAITAWRKAFSIDKRRTDMRLRIAKILEEKMNKVDDAIAEYQAYVNEEGVGPDHQVAKRIIVLRQLQQMEASGGDPFAEGGEGGEAPGDGDTPTDGAAPADGDAPAGDDAPSGDEAPADAPAEEGEAPQPTPDTEKSPEGAPAAPAEEAPAPSGAVTEAGAASPEG